MTSPYREEPFGGRTMADQIEREVKIRFADPAKARSAIEAAGGVESRSRSFEDNRIFDSPSRSHASKRSLLRVRAVAGGQGRLTLKEKVDTESRAKVRREWEITVEAPGALAEIFSRVGFEVTYRYQKYRTSFRIEDCLVELDETPIGCFVEIEGPEPSIFDIATRLGAGEEDLIAEDYRSLHLAWLEERRLPPGDMVFQDPAVASEEDG